MDDEEFLNLLDELSLIQQEIALRYPQLSSELFNHCGKLF
jgi:hypothetical protein